MILKTLFNRQKYLQNAILFPFLLAELIKIQTFPSVASKLYIFYIMYSRDKFQPSFQSAIAKHLKRQPQRTRCPKPISNMLRDYESRSVFEHGINESQLFKTSYYEDIADRGDNVEMLTKPQELNRILGKMPKKQGNDSQIRDFYDYAADRREPTKSKKLHEYEMKTVSHQAISEDLQFWAPYYCSICKKYDTGDHNSAHTGKQAKQMKKIPNFKSIRLSEKLVLLQIRGGAECRLRGQCVFHLKSILIQAASSGELDQNLFEANHKADQVVGEVQSRLNGMKVAIGQGMSYCMLKMLLMDKEISCLVLYFCVRKILGESPLDLDILQKVYPPTQRQPELDLQPIEQVQIVNVSYKPKKSKFALSKSTVCQGAGVFATSPIAKNSLIGYYLGQVIFTQHEYYATRTEYQQKMQLSSYSFDIKQQIEVDSSFYGNFTRMLNHMPSDFANCKFKKQSNNKVALISTKDISVGDELFVNYGAYYNEDWKEDFDKIMRSLMKGENREQMMAPKQRIVSMEIQEISSDKSESPPPPKYKNRGSLFWCVKSGEPQEIIEID